MFDGIEYIKCIFYFFKLSGTATMSFKTTWIETKNMWQWTFKQSYCGIVYNVLLIIFIAALYSSTSLFAYSINYNRKHQFEKVMCVIVDGWAVLTAIFILVSLCFQQKNAIKLAEKINKIREFSQSVDGRVSNKRYYIMTLNLKILSKNILILLFLTCISIDKIIFSVYLCILSICVMIINASFMQYSTILELIRHFYEFINKNLRGISEIDTVKSINISCSRYIYLQVKLDRLLHMYSLVTELSQDISAFYSQVMMMCSIYVFLSTVFNAYFFVKPVLEQNLVVHIDDFVSLLYITFQGSSLIVLTIAVDSTIDEVMTDNSGINS